MKRVLSLILTVVMLIGVLPVISVGAAVDNSKYVPKIIGLDGEAALAFDPDLARIARKMSADAYGVEEGSIARNIAETLVEEEFEDIQQRHYTDDSSMPSVSNSFLVGVKTFKVDGRKKYVVAIAFRGTKLVDSDFDDKLSDLFTDASCWDYDGIHIGFRAAAIKGYNTLCNMKFDSLNMTFKEYLKKCYDSNDYSIFVTGHSLGGAVANVFVGEILTKYEGIWSNAMCYTFATPKVCSESKKRLRSAYNVFNIINTEDTIPTWGYKINKGGRYGTDLTATVDKGDWKANHKIDGTYEEVTEKVISSIDSQYKYTIPYYNKWRKEVLGIDDTPGVSGGGSREEDSNAGNNAGNNASLGKSIVGVIDIPSSWDNLSIRSGPSTNYSIVGSMNDGVRCNVYPDKTQNGWYYVEYNGVYGYASGKQINTSGAPTPAPTPTPSTPPTLTASKTTVNLDLSSKPSETLTFTGYGDLPDPWKINASKSSALEFSWGKWSGNSITLTITATKNAPESSVATFYLVDSDTGENCYSLQVNINVTKPAVAPPKVSVSNKTVNIENKTGASATICFTGEGDMAQKCSLRAHSVIGLAVSPLGWQHNKCDVLIEPWPDAEGTYEIKFEVVSGDKVYQTIYVTVYVNKAQPPTMTLSKSTLNLDVASKRSDTVDITVSGTYPEGSVLEFSNGQGLRGEWTARGINSTLKITASSSAPKSSTVTISLKDSTGKALLTKKIAINVAELKTCTLSFDANGGTGAPAECKEEYGHVVSVGDRFKEPQRPGYIFLGYSTDKNAKTPQYQAGQSIIIESDMVLYAIWEKDETEPVRISVSKKNIYFDSDSNPSETITIYIEGQMPESPLFDIDYRDKATSYKWGKMSADGKSKPLTLSMLDTTQDGDVITIKVWDQRTDELLATATVTLHVAEVEDEISVYVDGKRVKFDVPPMLINDRTMVPMRAIFEALGADVSWDADAWTAIGEMDNNRVEITIGENYLYRNGRAVALDSPAVVISGRTLVPVRAISENLNCDVEWDGDLNRVYITSKPSEPSEPSMPSEQPAESVAGGELAEGEYVIATKLDRNFVLNIAGGAYLGTFTGERDQVFEVYNFDGIHYKIIHISTGKVLGVLGMGTNGDSARVGCVKYTGDPAQLWRIEDAGDGSYYIVNQGTGLYLDVENAYAEEDNIVQLFVRNPDYKSQNWVFLRK